MNILSAITHVNYVGVLLATIAAFVFGFVWYVLLFSKKRMQCVGLTQEQCKSKIFFSMGFDFVMTGIGATVIAIFAGGGGVQQGMSIGLLIGVVVMVSMLSSATYEQKPSMYKLISAIYILIVWVLIGGVVGYF